jgi:Family of unknown function (DUF6459)
MPRQQVVLSPTTEYPPTTEDPPTTEYPLAGEYSPAADDALAFDVTPLAGAPTAPVVRLMAVPNWADPRGDETADEDGGTLAAQREPGRCATGPAPTTGPLPARSLAAASQPGDWPHRFARMVAEVLAGARPARQIMPWTSKRARSQFHRILPEFRSASGQPRIMRVVASYPTLDAIELSVIAGFGPRTRAFAIRLERLPADDRSRLARRLPWPDAVMTASGGWVCTDIEAA